jgi:eukaryotic-like serine/threonine-protein kinase
MGRVWAARQVGSPLQRIVAVKTAISGQSQTAEFQRLFMDEARIASLILHPHVCGVYELGEDKGVMYLVMEWCDGASLRQVMDNVPGANVAGGGAPGGRMDLGVAVRIVAAVGAGLHAAHELEDNDGTKLRVVHRDVSPQNILISKNGHVKVADFGVAKAAGQLHRPTETGEMKGKLAYMAPEQVTAKEIDCRADVFALGCVLYETTVGRRPFHGEGALSTLYQLLEQTVTEPVSLVPDYPLDLQAIVLKSLAKDPAGRYQTAEDMRIALEAWLARSGKVSSERSIAELMQKTCGAVIDEKSARINDAIKNLELPREVPHAKTASQPPASTPSGRPGPKGDSSSVDRGVTTASGRREKSSWLTPALASAAVLAVVAAFARGTLSPSQATASDNQPATPAAVQAPALEISKQPTAGEDPPARPQTARIAVRTVPEDATIRIDDGPSVTSPYVGEVLANGSSRVVEVSAPGYASELRRVIFDRDQDLLIELASLTPGKKGTKPVRKPIKGKTEQSSQAAPPVTSPYPSSASVSDPPVKPKKPRTLDMDNPFGG